MDRSGARRFIPEPEVRKSAVLMCAVLLVVLVPSPSALGQMDWADLQPRKIRRRNLDGTGVGDRISSGEPFGVALLPSSARDFTFTQVTATTGNCGNFPPMINADGTRIAFGSSCNLTGGNADGNEEIYISETTTGTSTQITTTSGGCSNVRPTLNADGSRIAFQSTCDLTGSNADGSDEIYLIDTTTSTLTQITTTSSGCTNARPSINADGTRVAFQSTCDLTGANADGNQEIYLFDTATRTFTQITTTSACSTDPFFMFSGSGSPVINADGTRIAFGSTCNLTGDNADGNVEIYLFDTTISGFALFTSTSNCANFPPVINADGTRIILPSTCNLVGGSAGDNDEIYLFDATTRILTQITTTSGGCSNARPSINADGTRVAFQSTCDLTGANADGNQEIYLFDTTTGTFTQITTTSACSTDPFFMFSDSGSPVINADGTRIAFGSTCNLAGNNADGNVEISLAVSGSRMPCVGDCNDDRSVTIDELLTLVNIALGQVNVSVCTSADANGDQKIAIDEILTAVNYAINGCST